MKRKSALKYSQKKLENQKKTKILFFKTPVVMDDKSYFTLDGTNGAGNNTYNCKEGMKSGVKFKRHAKFQRMFLDH